MVGLLGAKDQRQGKKQREANGGIKGMMNGGINGSAGACARAAG